MSQTFGFDPGAPHNANSVKAIESARDKIIESAKLDADDLLLAFVDGSTLRFADRGQDCCEHRYMTCDDDLQSFTGDKFIGAELSSAPERDDGYDVHEVQFLRIKLESGNVITCETHNEHNGFYGGFNVEAIYDAGH